ncbi:helix-turn-helix domain-containing protein [Flavisolibacter tropicus]|uniref:HTH araC/xylS-type domain-containing protein n=1 Tax=Flavisolibacter tropicus TaxID=1492898 RepID=A0A172TWI3_9BACT|nr:hypothetical protein [Flavisolibacter tropicus]ANE51445.1 hypothetical protein SY85_13955 [Flavisolibacter tropicus]
MLKDVKCGDLRYRRHYYDYQEGTLVFIAPGQVVSVENEGELYQPLGYSLVFHPDLIHGTTLGRYIDEYSLLIDVAKERIFDTSRSVSEIAYELGFKYPQHFTLLFK